MGTSTHYTQFKGLQGLKGVTKENINNQVVFLLLGHNNQRY